MEECDPLTVQTSSGRNPDYTHDDFVHKLKVQILPNDKENQGEFDVGVDFRIGDPNVNFRAAAAESHMKPLRRLASRTGTFCLASFLPG